MSQHIVNQRKTQGEHVQYQMGPNELNPPRTDTHTTPPPHVY